MESWLEILKDRTGIIHIFNVSSVTKDDRGYDTTEPPTKTDTIVSSTANSTVKGKSRNLVTRLHRL